MKRGGGWPSLAVALLAACSSGQEPAVAFVSPAGETWTNGTLRIQVQAGTAVSVELLVDGVALANLAAPFVYDWDTTGLAEGPHALSARGIFQGRGGEVAVEAAPLTVHVDRTPPTVVSRSPEPGDAFAWVGTRIEVGLSEPVTGTVAFAASGSALPPGGALAAALSADGQRITFTSSGPAQVPGDLTVGLLPGLADRAGNALALPLDAWSFGYQALARRPIAEAYWVYEAAPGLVRDPSGRLLLAWTEMADAGGSFVVHGRLAGDADGFGQRQAIPEGASGLAVAPDGTRHLACPGVAGDPLVLTYQAVDVYRSTAQGWTSLGHASAASPAQQGLVALDSAGTPWVASSASDWDRGWTVYVSRWSGGVWSAVGSRLGSGPGWAAHPTFLAVDGTGAPVVAWQEYLGPSGSWEYHLSRFDGAAWQELTLPASFYYVYAMGADGAPLVAFQDGGACTGLVRRWNGAAWEPVGAAVATCNVTALAVDGQGVVWLATLEAATSVRRLEAGAFATVHQGPGLWWRSLGVNAEGEPWLVGSQQADALYVLGPNR